MRYTVLSEIFNFKEVSTVEHLRSIIILTTASSCSVSLASTSIFSKLFLKDFLICSLIALRSASMIAPLSLMYASHLDNSFPIKKAGQRPAILSA